MAEYLKLSNSQQGTAVCIFIVNYAKKESDDLFTIFTVPAAANYQCDVQLWD
jgi:hypothetical protein